MTVTESTPNLQRRLLINDVTVDSGAMLGLNLKTDSPQFIMQTVDSAFLDLVLERPTPISEVENPHLHLGSLWGAQMKRQFSWYWAEVVIDDMFDEIAMISPRQEMIIFPFSFTAACMRKQCVCTQLLAFTMLLETDDAGSIPPDAYKNIMLDVHHPVPPYVPEHSA